MSAFTSGLGGYADALDRTGRHMPRHAYDPRLCGPRISSCSNSASPARTVCIKRPWKPPRENLSAACYLARLQFCYISAGRYGLVIANSKKVPGTEPQAKVFISYSRKDKIFTDRLEAALEERGFEALIDRSEIYAFEDW